jgi:hypothetical protein
MSCALGLGRNVPQHPDAVRIRRGWCLRLQWIGFGDSKRGGESHCPKQACFHFHLDCNGPEYASSSDENFEAN